MTEGQYKFSISLDDKQLKMDVAQAKKAFDELVKAAREAGVKIDESFDNPFDKLVPPTNLPRQTEAAAQSFNGLNMVTQQLVRELPAATMGLNTFFLAISNNLPIFADQIKAATEANKELVAQGKPTTSVFKQIIGSLLSWQTALIAGVTFLSMYGKEIGQWIKSLFKGKEAVDAMAEAQRQLHETRLQGTINAQEEATNLMITVKAMQDSSRTLEDRRLAMQRLQGEYPSYFANMSEEILLYGDLSSTITELVTNMYNMQRARTALDQLVKNKESMELLKGTAGYSEWESRNKAYDKVGREVKTVKKQVGGREQDYVKVKTGEVEQIKLEQASEKLLETLEAQGGKAAELVETIKDRFDGDIDAWIKSIEAANIALEGDVKPLVDDANEAERKRQQEEAKRRAEEAARQARIAANAKKSEQDQITRMTEQLAKDAAEARTDATIVAMEEGLKKEKAQINAEYDAKAQLISEREAELKKLQKGALTADQQADLQALRDRNEQMRNEEIKAADEAYQRKVQEENAKRTADQQAWNEYLIAYGTFQERLKATQDKYATEIANAKNDGEKKMLEAERDAILAEFAVQADGFGKDLVTKTTEELTKMIEQLRAQVEAKQKAFDALASSDEATAQTYREEINKLNAQIKVLQGLLGKVKDNEIAEDDWQGVGAGFERVGQSISSLGVELEGLDDNIGKTVKNIGEVSSVVGGLISAIGSGPLAIAIVAIQAITKIISAIASARAEYEQLMNSTKELNDELERTNRLARINSLEGTIFGDDAFANFSNNLAAMRDAAQAFTKSQDAIINRGKEMTNSTVDIQEWATVISSFKWDNIDESLKNMQVLVKDRGKFAESWGFKDKYKSLGDMLPGLFGDEGVTLEALKNLRNSDVWEKLSEENRTLIDNMIADWEMFEESTKSVTDYLKGIFGSLGNEINDAIVDAFANGTDAAVAFGDVAGKMLENLISQIGYTAYIAPILSKAMADVDALNKGQDLSAEDYLNALMGIVGDTMKAAEDAVEGYNEFLERSDRMAEEQGINTFNGERTAVAKGIAQASQDSVDELNGRMTAIQSHTSMLVDGQKQLINDSAQALTYLAGIESNTAELKQMRQDMGAMRKDISDIATRGIVTR